MAISRTWRRLEVVAVVALIAVGIVVIALDWE